MRSPLKYYGSDNYTANRIADLFPRRGCSLFVEGCAGSAAVTFARPTYGHRLLNDLNQNITRFWRAVRDEPAKLVAQLAPYHPRTVEHARDIWERNETEYDGEPYRTFIRYTLSRAGSGLSFSYDFRKGRASWDVCVSRIPVAASHLKGIGIRSFDVLELVRDFDGPTVHMYIDPPFHHSSRVSPSVYAIEQGDDWHRRFLLQCCESRAKIVVSGYRCDLYDALLTRWRRVDFQQRNAASSKVRLVTESFWCNFE